MRQFKEQIEFVLSGSSKEDRTGTGTISKFGFQSRYDLCEGFPLLGLKLTRLKPIFEELMWFLRGETNIATLNSKIWDEWAYEKFVKHFLTLPVNEIPTAWTIGNCIVGGEPVPIDIHDFKDMILSVPSFAEQFGDLGPIYGKQWRSWDTTQYIPEYESENGMGFFEGQYVKGSIDQIKKAIDTIKKNPTSRRIIVSAWNPADVDDMALPPCHTMFQFYCEEIPDTERLQLHNEFIRKHEGRQLFKCCGHYLYPEDHVMQHEDDIPEPIGFYLSGADKRYMDEMGIPKHYLSCQLYQRSADLFLGVPFNTASYALLTLMIAQVTNTVPKEFIHSFGDIHIYKNHLHAVEEILSRESPKLPQLSFKRKVTEITDYKFEDLEFTGYNPLPAIKLPVAV